MAAITPDCGIGTAITFSSGFLARMLSLELSGIERGEIESHHNGDHRRGEDLPAERSLRSGRDVGRNAIRHRRGAADHRGRGDGHDYVARCRDLGVLWVPQILQRQCTQRRAHDGHGGDQVHGAVNMMLNLSDLKATHLELSKHRSGKPWLTPSRMATRQASLI